MEMHFATVWEAIADAIGDHTAIRHGAVARTWAEYDERAARLAAAFTAAGLGHDTKVGLYLYNSNEYLEAQYAAFKIRASPVNVNYRYLDEELWYLLDNADAEALVFHTSLADRVARVRDRLPKLKLLIQVDDGGEPLDGAAAYDDLVAAHDPAPRITRDEADVYMLYTGGTTGMPKGVMYATGAMTATFVAGGYPLVGLTPPTDAAAIPALVRQLADAGTLPVSIPTCPLMHGTGVWLGAFIPQLAGGEVITMTSRSLDGDEVFGAVQRHKATTIVIVGDAMARPLVRALDDAAARGSTFDTSSRSWSV